MVNGARSASSFLPSLAAFSLGFQEPPLFDRAIKRVSDDFPEEVVSLLSRIIGLRARKLIGIVQPNLPPATIEADRVYRLGEPSPMLLHTEWESSSSLGRPDRFHEYNVLLTKQTEFPVKTVVILLRPDANSSDLTGELTRTIPEEPAPYLIWRYSVIRLWELPVEMFLQSPGTTPFAALAQVPLENLPGVIEQMEEQWRQVDEREARELKTITELWLGFRFDPLMIHRLFKENTMLEESTIYQEIHGKGLKKGLEEGRQEGRAEGRAEGRLFGERQAVLRIGTKRLGEPTAAQRLAIESVTDAEHLDRMLDIALDANDWASIVGAK